MFESDPDKIVPRHMLLPHIINPFLVKSFSDKKISFQGRVTIRPLFPRDVFFLSSNFSPAGFLENAIMSGIFTFYIFYQIVLDTDLLCSTLNFCTNTKSQFWELLHMFTTQCDCQAAKVSPGQKKNFQHYLKTVVENLCYLFDGSETILCKKMQVPVTANKVKNLTFLHLVVSEIFYFS